MNPTPIDREARVQGWRTVGIGIAVQFLHFGLFQQAYTVYVPVLILEMGWTAAALGGVYALHQATAGAIAPVQGWAITRFGGRAVAIAGTLVLSVALIGLSTAQTLTAFALWFVLGAVGQYLAGFLTLVSSVVSWFGRSSTSALGVMQTGLSLAGLAAPAVAWGVAAFGWRQVFLASGGAVAVLGLPLVLLLRPGPQAARSPAWGAAADTAPFRRAVRSGAFWSLAAGHALAVGVAQAVNVYLVLYLTNQGVTLPTAAGIVAVTTAAMLCGQLSVGVLASRAPTRWLTAGCMGAHAAALTLLLIGPAEVMMVPFALLHGAAWGLRGPLMQSMRVEYFGSAAFPRVMGLSILLVTIGAVVGPFGAGLAAEAFGGFREVFVVLIAASLTGAACFGLSVRPGWSAELT